MASEIRMMRRGIQYETYRSPLPLATAFCGRKEVLRLDGENQLASSLYAQGEFDRLTEGGATFLATSH